jgi:hypothetical protein
MTLANRATLSANKSLVIALVIVRGGQSACGEAMEYQAILKGCGLSGFSSAFGFTCQFHPQTCSQMTNEKRWGNQKPA